LLSLGAALALLLPALGAAPLDDPGEGQHAEIAREAWADGHWLPLRLAGVRYVDKPPLPYALAAAAYQVFGVGGVVCAGPGAAPGGGGGGAENERLCS
jgi:4-amino-4-deoxy-L-arabinose transferase-like glycosyltransferase